MNTSKTENNIYQSKITQDEKFSMPVTNYSSKSFFFRMTEMKHLLINRINIYQKPLSVLKYI